MKAKTFTLSDRQIAYIEKYSKKLGLKEAELARRMLDAWIDKHLREMKDAR